MVETRRRRSRALPPRPQAVRESPSTRDSPQNSSRQTRTSHFSSKKDTAQQQHPQLHNSAVADAAVGSMSTNNNKAVVGNDDTTATAGTERHFLHGFQLERCQDALSIPDPPSPSMKVVNRRLSSPIVTFPLREISNASDVEDDDPKVTTRRKKKKRTRNSLAHLHSPMEPSATAAVVVSSTATAVEDNKFDAAHTSTPAAATTTKTDQDELGSKRCSKKKRQSMLLPSDLESSEEGGSGASNTNNQEDEFTKTYASFKNKPSPPATPAKETKTPTKPSTNTLVELRKLVHAYTNLPKEQRDDSAPAKEIMERTGYCPRSAPNRLSTTTSSHNEPSREQKLNFFSKLGPDLQKMDACKVSDAKMVAEVTQCRAQKVRGGYYRYFHNETGRAVSPDEFEERYLLMLEEVNQIRSESWANYFDKLREEDEERVRSERSAVVMTTTTTSPQENEAAKPDVGAPDESTSSQMEVDDDMEEDKESQVSGTDGRTTATTNPSPPSTPHSTTLGDDGKSSTPMEVDNALLLPIPSRDEESSDPRIANAERKLWKSIDKALRVYSREVLAAQGAPPPPTPVHC